MILTVTLNPAIDKTYRIKDLVNGSVNRMESVVSIAGGKGVNVAKVIKQYEIPVTAAGFLGGYAGQFIEDALQEKGINCAFTKVNGETRSNMNIAADDGTVTELLEPGPVIGKTEIAAFLEQYDNLLNTCEIVVLSGSFARGIDDSFYEILVEKAHEKNRKVLLDTSGEGLRKGLKKCPDICKPNRAELEYLVGHPLNDMEAVISAAVSLRETGIDTVLVSLGKEGLLAVNKEYIYHAVVDEVPVVNTVGCGDSVMASFAMSLWQDEDMEEAVKKAAARSAANATTIESGSIPIAIAEDYEKLVRFTRRRLH